MSQNKIVTRYMLLLLPAGIIINVLGAKFVLHFELPLFFDSMGTVLIAAMGGYLPGIIVGFFSNIINGISDPITYYYGIISILIASATAFFTRRGLFNSIKRLVLFILVLTFIGGGLGAGLTWLIYGFQFGSGISAPYAIYIHQSLGLSEFASQLTADMLIDMADKTITVIAAVIAVRLLPDSFLLRFPNGVQLDGARLHKSELAGHRGEKFRGRDDDSAKPVLHSLRTEVIILIIVTAVLLGTLATGISFELYKESMTKHYTKMCRSAVVLMDKAIDADKIDGYLKDKNEKDLSYAETARKIGKIGRSFGNVKYAYVYQIREDGCHVVFDMDVPGLKGEPLGAKVDFDQGFEPYLDRLLEGKSIQPVITNETYGWLLTVYRPLKDSQGQCKAYAAVDVDMEDVITDRYIFMSKMISLLFGSAIILVVMAIWFAERRLIAPVDDMTQAASHFVISSEKERVKSIEQMQRLNIHTKNEIETLYKAVNTTMTSIVGYINTIDSLQENTLLCFANLVESRDNTTGMHIKRTAIIVRIIAEELFEEGLYADVMTPDYIDRMEKAAPLHDVGKIEIPDAILNKPGKLTEEEFEIMKTHASAGGRIITDLLEHTDGLSYLWDARDMARYHHERWDGTGYGQGISGRNIPLSARIMAVSDVFDALISKRPYKEAMTYEKALEIILSESGTHFDPQIAEAFHKAFGRICHALSPEEGDRHL